LPTDLGHIAARERPNAAMPAEQMVPALGRELIVAEISLAGDQAEGVRLDGDSPVSCLGADRAVALAGAAGKIEIRFEADRPAVAASVIGLQHDITPLDRWSAAMLRQGCCQAAVSRWRLLARKSDAVTGQNRIR